VCPYIRYVVHFKLAHGADPFLKNQEGQSPVDLASAEDVRCLLQDAMASQQNVPTAPASAPPSRPPSIAVASPAPTTLAAALSPPVATETVIMPSGASMTLCIPVSRACLSPMPAAEGCCATEPVKPEGGVQDMGNVATVAGFLARWVMMSDD